MKEVVKRVDELNSGESIAARTRVAPGRLVCIKWLICEREIGHGFQETSRVHEQSEDQPVPTAYKPGLEKLTRKRAEQLNLLGYSATGHRVWRVREGGVRTCLGGADACGDGGPGAARREHHLLPPPRHDRAHRRRDPRRGSQPRPRSVSLVLVATLLAACVQWFMEGESSSVGWLVRYGSFIGPGAVGGCVRTPAFWVCVLAFLPSPSCILQRPAGQVFAPPEPGATQQDTPSFLWSLDQSSPVPPRGDTRVQHLWPARPWDTEFELRATHTALWLCVADRRTRGRRRTHARTHLLARRPRPNLGPHANVTVHSPFHPIPAFHQG